MHAEQEEQSLQTFLLCAAVVFFASFHRSTAAAWCLSMIRICRWPSLSTGAFTVTSGFCRRHNGKRFMELGFQLSSTSKNFNVQISFTWDIFNCKT